jgi:hypothetical protein
MAITGRERGPQPAVKDDRRLSDFRPPQLSVLQPPLTLAELRVPVRLLSPGAYIVRLGGVASDGSVAATSAYRLQLTAPPSPAPPRTGALAVMNETGEPITVIIAGQSTRIASGTSELDLAHGVVSVAIRAAAARSRMR